MKKGTLARVAIILPSIEKVDSALTNELLMNYENNDILRKDENGNLQSIVQVGVSQMRTELKEVIHGMSSVIVSVKSSNWIYSEDDKIYTNTIVVDRADSKFNPVYSLVSSGDEITQEELDAYSNIERMDVFDGFIVLYSHYEIKSDIKISLSGLNNYVEEQGE